MESIKIDSGKILLAEPFMFDMNFKRAAILLCEHNKEGSLGFILNKRLEMQINQLIADFPEFDSEVFYGGPVATDTIHYVHNLGHLLDDSQYVSDGVFWGGDFEKLKALIREQMIKPDDIRFFVGYSGWSGGQLHDEFQHGSWVMADMDSNYLFKTEPEELWQQVMHNKGNNFSVIAQMPDGVNWN